MMYNLNVIFKRYLLAVVFTAAFFVLGPVGSFAQTRISSPSDPCPDKAGMINNPLSKSGICSIPEFIETLLIGLVKIGMPIIALAIIYSGFLFVAARGNSEKLTKAKDALLYTLIGAAILLGSWSIAMLISETVLAL
jgi:hypothetical protein